MNQVKTKDLSADTVDPFTNIVLSGEAGKLGVKAQGKIHYEVALHGENNQHYFRIAGQTEKGLHSKQWILLSSLFELIESQGDQPWKSQIYKVLFSAGSANSSSGSANNHAFCAAITRELGLATRSPSSLYLHVINVNYQKNKESLMVLGKAKTISRKKQNMESVE
ncbi:TPA: hypothetical protein I7666_21510 [Vibrio vulnificus]|nr:hypothetical protein [Vibrio vulnificus]